jgi:hypothetical protein
VDNTTLAIFSRVLGAVGLISATRSNVPWSLEKLLNAAAMASSHSAGTTFRQFQTSNVQRTAECATGDAAVDQTG